MPGAMRNFKKKIKHRWLQGSHSIIKIKLTHIKLKYRKEYKNIEMQKM